MWAFAARNKNNPLKLERDLKFLEEDKPLGEEVQRKLDLIAEGQKIVQDFYREMGITPSAPMTLRTRCLKNRHISSTGGRKG